MMKVNKIIDSVLIFSIFLTLSACTSAESPKINFKKYESEQLQCGTEKIKVISYCFDPEEGLTDRGSGGVVRECKSSTLDIMGKKVIDLPILEKKSTRILKNNTFTQGDISLISVSCIKNKEDYYLSLTQGISNNINEMSEKEYKEFSNPILLDLKGNAIQENIRKKVLISKNKKIEKFVFANSVYGGI
jgi:hypothetical protein